MKSILFISSLSLLVFSGCGVKTKKREEISTLEKLADRGYDRELYARLAAQYEDFASVYPNDTNSRNFLFRAANVCITIQEGSRSIELFDKYIERYPGDSKISDCIFLKAFAYETILHDYTSAEKFYLEFLEKYPDDPRTLDVELSIQQLGRPPEDILREFMERESDTLRAGPDEDQAISGTGK
jgi:outer membrane protein assembly factor BamD (BamD/ComL family)